MVASWDEIKGGIKYAYDKIESAYQKLGSSVDKVKERPSLNMAVKTALPFIPIIGPTLSAIYDNIGGGTKSEEDRAKQVLDFLSELEQKNKEQFDRIAQDLKTNRHAIIDAINANKITMTDLISKSSAEILEAVGSVKEDTRVIRLGIETFLEKRHEDPSRMAVERLLEDQREKKEKQKLKKISSTHSHLIRIINGFEQLKKLQFQEESERESTMRNIVNNIESMLERIETDADTQQYFRPIKRAISNFQNGDINRAMSIYEAEVKDKILNRWWEVRIEDASKVKTALGSFNKNWIIVHGAIEASRDAECARKLSQELEGSTIMTDAELEASKGKERNDIISVGGPGKNSFVARLNYTLPVQYVDANITENKEEGSLFSLVNYEFHHGYGNSTIQVIRNPFNPQGKTVVVLVFGIDRGDTPVAVNKLIDIIQKKELKLLEAFLDTTNRNYPALVIRKSVDECEKTSFDYIFM